MLENALRECDLAPYEIVLTDCSEYPCVAGLRPAGTSGSWIPEPGPKRFEMRTRLFTALRECASVLDFVEPGVADGAIAIGAQVAPCPDGNEDLWSVFILDPEGMGFAYVTKDESTELEDAELERWAHARTGALVRRWPCMEAG